jgi:hypothetical protein
MRCFSWPLPLCLDIPAHGLHGGPARRQQTEALAPECFLPQLFTDLRILFFQQPAAGALISVDELYYAGFMNMKDNKNNYLYSIYPYWTMTPAYYYKSNAYNFIVNKNNLSQLNVTLDSAIRPVISLKGNLKINSGDGSMENPYILSR